MHWSDLAYGIKFVALRYFNVAGAKADGSIGEDHGPETHLVPIVLQVANGQRDTLKIFGTDYDTPDGTNVRDYVHVVDLADATFLPSSIWPRVTKVTPSTLAQQPASQTARFLKRPARLLVKKFQQRTHHAALAILTLW